MAAFLGEVLVSFVLLYKLPDRNHPYSMAFAAGSGKSIFIKIDRLGAVILYSQDGLLSFHLQVDIEEPLILWLPGGNADAVFQKVRQYHRQLFFEDGHLFGKIDMDAYSKSFALRPVDVHGQDGVDIGVQ